jgi:hypothetical protein
MNRAATFTAVVAFVELAILAGCSESPPPGALADERQLHPELEFFNGLSGELLIELTAPAENVGNTANQRAPASARIRSLELQAEVFEEDSHTARPLTARELGSVAFEGASIRLRGEGDRITFHDAPNGRFFTVQELLNAVEESERQSRASSEWLGGVDVHHIFFEGIHPAQDGVWDIYWGS